MALDFYGLRKDLDKLKKHRNFLYTSVWPEYGHVMEFFESGSCIAALTDSGGVQEELNILGKACMTCRLTTDRPETVFDAKSNIIVPPASKDLIVKMVKHITINDNLRKTMESSKSLYGKNAGEKLISRVSHLMKNDDKPFKWAHDTLKLWRDDEKGINYL